MNGQENCGCGGHEHHGHHEQGMGMGGHHQNACGCGCHEYHGHMGFKRHFIPREERIARLEEYLNQLQAEAKGVEERLEELKNATE